REEDEEDERHHRRQRRPRDQREEGQRAERDHEDDVPAGARREIPEQNPVIILFPDCAFLCLTMLNVCFIHLFETGTCDRNVRSFSSCCSSPAPARPSPIDGSRLPRSSSPASSPPTI